MAHGSKEADCFPDDQCELNEKVLANRIDIPGIFLHGDAAASFYNGSNGIRTNSSTDGK